MAVVLVIRPWGLFGRKEGAARASGGRDRNAVGPLDRERPACRPRAGRGCGAAAPVLGPYGLAVATEVAIFVLFAASLHLLMSVGGLASFGHAAFFGLGCLRRGAGGEGARPADGAGARRAGLLLAALGRGGDRLVRGAALGRLFRHADARLRPDRLVDRLPVVAVTGGDNGLLGIWPVAMGGEPAPASTGLTSPLVDSGRRSALARDHLLALRLCAARGARFGPAAPRRSASTGAACNGAPS